MGRVRSPRGRHGKSVHNPQIFEFLRKNPFHKLTIDSVHFKAVERYVVIWYDKLSPLESIHMSRTEMFCKNNSYIDKLPPTQVNDSMREFFIPFK